MKQSNFARVLIVDDEPSLRRTGKRVLEHCGYQVHTLARGQEAYEIFEKGAQADVCPYDLVLMDMQLNGEPDGLSYLDKIWQFFPKLKAMVVSGHAPSERVELAESREIPWLVKPYTSHDLTEAVRAMLTEHGSVPSMKVSSIHPTPKPTS